MLIAFAIDYADYYSTLSLYSFSLMPLPPCVMLLLLRRFQMPLRCRVITPDAAFARSLLRCHFHAFAMLIQID